MSICGLNDPTIAKSSEQLYENDWKNSMIDRTPLKEIAPHLERIREEEWEFEENLWSS